MVTTEKQKRNDAVSSSKFFYLPPALFDIHTEFLLPLNIPAHSESHPFVFSEHS